MSYGFLSKNYSEFVQIDENYTNYALVQKLIIAVSSSGRGYSGYFYAIEPMLFAQNLGGSMVNCSMEYSPTYGWRAVVLGPIGYSVTVYVFDTGQTPTVSGFGLSVYKANGSAAYSSNWQLLRIASVQAIPDNTIDYVGPTFTAPYSAAWAICLTQPKVFVDDGGGSPISHYWYHGFRNNSGSATVGFVQADPIQTGGEGGVIQRFGGSLIFADVTGY
jgi:hypothetical protein